MKLIKSQISRLSKTQDLAETLHHFSLTFILCAQFNNYAIVV